MESLSPKYMYNVHRQNIVEPHQNGLILHTDAPYRIEPWSAVQQDRGLPYSSYSSYMVYRAPRWHMKPKWHTFLTDHV